MDYKYPESYSTEQTTNRFKDVDGVYRYEVRGDLVKANIAKGLATIAKEDTLGTRAFKTRMREITQNAVRTTVQERADYMHLQYYYYLEITVVDGVTWLTQKPAETATWSRKGWETTYTPHQAQPIRLRDWWTRQLT